MKLKVLREQPASNICIAQVWSLVCSPNKFVCLILRLANDGMIKCVHILTGNSLQHSPFQILLMHCTLNQYSHMAVPYSIKESIQYFGAGAFWPTREYISIAKLCAELSFGSQVQCARVGSGKRTGTRCLIIRFMGYTLHVISKWTGMPSSCCRC